MKVTGESGSETLDKTTRTNLLLDFYGNLLTEKQRTFMQQYFYEDYSLGEIAEAFGISRQAVYEHIKRALSMLDDYETKLRLLLKHEQRQMVADDLQRLLQERLPGCEDCRGLLNKLMQVD